MMIEEKINIKWTCNSRVDYVDEEMLSLMGKAGNRLISWGIESGNEQILGATGKKITKEKIREAFRLIEEVGISTSSTFIIGLPGDTVEIRDGQVYVNGVALDEPDLRNMISYDMPARSVEEGRYFVMGDNRNNSSDSRSFGAIAPQSIVGRAWLIYWPPSDWGTVPHHTYAAMSAP